MKLISINIEGQLHVDAVRELLTKEQPDVIAFQEVFENDYEHFKEVLHMEGVFMPMARMAPYRSLASGIIVSREDMKQIGVAILSRTSIQKTYTHYYIGQSDTVPYFKKSEHPDDVPNTSNFLVLGIETMVGDSQYRIFTTHMPVTKDGESAPFQEESVDTILAFLEGFDEFVFCGDLNAPRGREAFDRFAAKYRDAIPAHYPTSLDLKLHRVPHLVSAYMVDGLFLTPGYDTKNVYLQDGVSDHMAIVADIVQS